LFTTLHEQLPNEAFTPTELVPPSAVTSKLGAVRENEQMTGGGRFDPVIVSPTKLPRTVSNGAAVPLVSTMFMHGPKPRS
jgi:hypothetical protein